MSLRDQGGRVITLDLTTEMTVGHGRVMLKSNAMGCVPKNGWFLLMLISLMNRWTPMPAEDHYSDDCKY